MRRSALLVVLAAALALQGCFPRVAHYDGEGPGPAPGGEQGFDPGTRDVPVERLVAFITMRNPWLPSDQVQREAEAIAKAAATHGVPSHLVAGLIATESSFNPRAVSPVGAQGLGQLMPATARDMGVTDPFDIEQNINGTTRYLAWLGKVWEKHPQRWEMVLASYLAGVGTVTKQNKAGKPLTNEQGAYVRKIISLSGKV